MHPIARDRPEDRIDAPPPRRRSPVAVGLVGAGPWAWGVHAPVLAAGPETRLAGVWARDQLRCRELAEAHGAPAFDRYEDLLAACEAVAFAVPPAVQAAMAPQAARCGRALLLEKPLAENVAEATRVHEEIAATGVPHLVAFTYRFVPAVQELLAAAGRGDVIGARACFFTGSYRGGPFAQGWRLEHGSLLDTGAHLVDILDAALGSIEEVRALRNGDWTTALLRHGSGAVSNLAVCSTVEVDGSRIEVELLSAERDLRVDITAATRAAEIGTSRVGGPLVDPSALPFRAIRQALATCVETGSSHSLNTARALTVQRALEQIDAALA
jgi:predicted dehydrogenase